MKLYQHRLALSASLAMGILYTLCASFMHVWPDYGPILTGDILHMRSMELFTPYMHVTLANYISGLLQLMSYTYLFFWCTAFFYNRLSAE